MSRLRRGFTLIELLVVVAILGIMVTAGVVSLTAGQGAARVRGATRDVVASIRHARSVALVSQQPATIAFSNVTTADGGTAASVKINSVRLISTNGVTRATTLSGEVVSLAGDDEPAPTTRRRSHTVNGEDAVVEDGSGGEDLGDILFSPVSEDVMRGIRLKVLTGDEADEASSVATTPLRTSSRISVFSTADYINSRYQDHAAKERAEAKAREADDGVSDAGDSTGPVCIVWEVNGRTEPHCVWVYPDGSVPEKGLLVRVDRFGAVKVLRGDGRDDEEE